MTSPGTALLFSIILLITGVAALDIHNAAKRKPRSGRTELSWAKRRRDGDRAAPRQ
jgi:hypothetical protein